VETGEEEVGREWKAMRDEKDAGRKRGKGR